MAADSSLPGVELVEPSRFRPRFHYELLVCGVSGHELIGIDARELRDEDRLVARTVEVAFSLQSNRLTLVGAVFAAYALVEGVEAVGLWFQRRWAEYLTFLVTASLLPLEVYELSHRLTVFKLVAFVINVAVVAYLLVAKRLFGLRGGAEAERRERERDMGWEALERSAPEVVGLSLHQRVLGPAS